MNRDEAKSILPLHRPGTTDADDPQVAAALDLAKRDPELARWSEAAAARQSVLREKFRQIEPPPGLKEQIVSEAAASLRRPPARRNLVVAAALAALVLTASVVFWQRGHAGPREGKLATFQSRMAGIALRSYAMDLESTDTGKIRTFLAEHHAPSNFVLPGPLKKLSEVGCAIPSWQNGSVAMICFRTGKPLKPGTPSDLWLFVVDRGLVKDAPENMPLKIARVNRLSTATWAREGKLYFLGAEGDEREIKKFVL